MTKPTSEEEAKGLRAYEQARAYERMRSWRLPLAYMLFPFLCLLVGCLLLAVGHVIMGLLQFGAAVAFSIGLWLNWERLRQRHEENLKLLRDLESAHGDQLPWLQVERHFAALEELKRELAEEKPKQG